MAAILHHLFRGFWLVNILHFSVYGSQYMLFVFCCQDLAISCNADATRGGHNNQLAHSCGSCTHIRLLIHSCTHTSGQWLQRQVPCIYNHTILSSYFVLPHKWVEDLASTQHCHTDGTRQSLNVLIYMIPPSMEQEAWSCPRQCWSHNVLNIPIMQLPNLELSKCRLS